MAEDDDLKAIIRKGFVELKIAVESTNPDPKQTIQGYRDMRAAQQKAADQLVVTTDALVNATRRLGVATWALFWTSLVIAFSTIAPYFWTLLSRVK